MPRTIWVPGSNGPWEEATAYFETPGRSSDRNAVVFDTITKSQFTKPVAYGETNACGVASYVKVSSAMAINQLINCTPTQALAISMSITAPRNTVDALGAITGTSGVAAGTLNGFIDYVQLNLVAEYAALIAELSA